eukprot:CAMPEP_0115547092 /NCGR_PEP_ID=MMETSP0271-20121206/93465_1 /TAXON_ID=71861 /ORGANISM="Scrippsiella trochoidea, Strain CCMP3099" /LENGTH=92 /DNA_ID=CAMNT_0002980507 /DNA_START=74 /DNA_END=349 /DNA_ORIENTATION=+
MAAARRPLLAVAVLALVAFAAVRVALVQEESFVAPSGASPKLRASQQGPLVAATARSALPDPRPNDAMLPVDLNRTSLYWGLLTICILSVLF